MTIDTNPVSLGTLFTNGIITNISSYGLVKIALTVSFWYEPDNLAVLPNDQWVELFRVTNRGSTG